MKIKTYDFREFVRNEYQETVKYPKYSLIPLAASPLIQTTAVHAESAEIQGKMMDAFEPIIDLIQGMAYPVAVVVVLGGALMLMVGNKEKGFSMMQTAGLGYVVVMIAPMILDVLVDAMGSMV